MPCDWNYYYDFEAELDIGKQAKISCENGRFVFECTFQCSKSDHYVLTQSLPYAWQLRKYRQENRHCPQPRRCHCGDPFHLFEYVCL